MGFSRRGVKKNKKKSRFLGKNLEKKPKIGQNFTFFWVI